MNKNNMLIVMASVIIGMILYPPYNRVASGGRIINDGYSWIFDAPTRYSTVNEGLLLTQIIAVAIIGVIGWFIFKGNTETSNIEIKPRDPNNKNFSETFTFGFLRLVRGFVGFIFAANLISLLSVVTWFSNPDAITGKMVVMLFIKILAVFIFGWLFGALRNVIHSIHLKWYGVEHPVLIKKMVL